MDLSVGAQILQRRVRFETVALMLMQWPDAFPTGTTPR